MTIDYVLDLADQIMKTAFLITLPVLALSMIIGLAVAIFQSATQIQEASLSFVPKLIGMALAIILFGTYILEKLSHFTITFISSIANVGK